jgi:hypothetical protein
VKKPRPPTPAQLDALGTLLYFGGWVFPGDMRAFTAQSLVVRGWATRRRGDPRLKLTRAGRDVYKAAK